jgi:hypothetical protein
VGPNSRAGYATIFDSLITDNCISEKVFFFTNDYNVSRELNDMVHTHQKHLQSWDEDRQRVLSYNLLYIPFLQSVTMDNKITG